MSLRIYVDGGGDQRVTSSQCREGFAEFFRKVVVPGKQPKIIACGSREAAFDDFKIALKKYTDDFVMLVVDAEGAVQGSPWAHLGWAKPANATDDHAHLMVQIMESWFLSDRGMLAEYFGQGFNANALPGSANNIEGIPKDDVLEGLKRATSNLKTKKPYSDRTKVQHGFALLALVDPAKVKSASPQAQRLIDFVASR